MTRGRDAETQGRFQIPPNGSNRPRTLFWGVFNTRDFLIKFLKVNLIFSDLELGEKKKMKKNVDSNLETELDKTLANSKLFSVEVKI